MDKFCPVEEIYSLFKKHRKICTDTRHLEPDSVFFALKGENFDANTLAAQAVKGGCACAVVDNPKYAKGDNIYLVEDVLETLQKIAVMYRKTMMIPVIGITGTNGKTTTKELLKSVLGTRYKTYATEGNLNNHIGVPLTLLRMSADTEIAVIEMGANHPGEIAKLCRIALPTFGIITNIGTAHLEGFGGIENIIETKTALYRSVRKVGGKIFVNGDDGILMRESEGAERFCYGQKETHYLQMTRLENDHPKLTCLLHGTATVPSLTKVPTELIGRYNLSNVAAAACAGRYFNLNDKEIAEGISGYTPSNLRSQLIQTDKNVIIADAYNANPSSMTVSLENFAKMQSTGLKLPVLGDMLELGPSSGTEHQKIVDLLVSLNFTEALLVGAEFAKTNRPANYQSFAKAEDLIKWFEKNPVSGRCLLVKGSHGIHLERVIEALR